MEIEKILENNRKAVNTELKKFLSIKVSEEWLIKNIGTKLYDEKAVNEFFTNPAREFVERGGKRWRPLLVLLCCGVVGGNPGSIKKFAIIPELIHNGSLIADDIEDMAQTRRNKPALHIKYGLDIAVNLSSLLYYLPLLIVKQSKMSESLKSKIYEMFNLEMLKLHIGQGTDIYWHKLNVLNVTEGQYFAMCANKTGTIARLAAQLGALLANGTKTQVQALGKFAEAIGIAFQIQDDVLNISGNLGKDFGEDITEGKMSLPVIRTLAIAKNKDRNILVNILKEHTTKRDTINKAVAIINHYHALEYSKDVGMKIVAKSWKELSPLFAQSEAKNTLIELAKYLTRRTA